MEEKLEHAATNNKLVTDYLEYYVGINKSPDFAVLLKGDWGAGKSFLIRKFREEQEKKGRKFIFVSLYGVREFSEIEDQFFQQMHPILSTRPFSIGGRLLRNIFKGALRIDLEDVLGKSDASASLDLQGVNIREYLDGAEDRILIFDDLERCEMESEEVLGYINSFVEHQGLKVIILGNESELIKKFGNEYLQKNEKLIGKKLQLSADFSNVYPEFLKIISDDGVRKALEEHSDIVFDVFKKVKCENLRILRYAVVEYERLFSLLPDKAKNLSKFQKECIRIAFSTCIEIREGRLDPARFKALRDEYQNQFIKEISSKDKSKDTREDSASSLYEKIFGKTFETPVLSGEFLYHFFRFGSVPDEVANAMIEGCRLFHTENTPAWRKLLEIWWQEDDEFSKNYEDVINDFTNLRITAPGVVKHVVGAMLFFSRNEMASMNHSKMKSFLKKVVRKLCTENLLEVSPEEDDHSFGGAFGGIAFFDRETKEFSEITDLIKAYQSRRRIETNQSDAKRIPEMLIKNPAELERELTGSSGAQRKWGGIPILQYVDYKEFASSYFKIPAFARHEVHQTFKARYRFLDHNSLHEEMSWLKSVKSELLSRSKDFGPLTKFHVRELVKQGLDPAIEQMETRRMQRTAQK